MSFTIIEEVSNIKTMKQLNDFMKTNEISHRRLFVQAGCMRIRVSKKDIKETLSRSCRVWPISSVRFVMIDGIRSAQVFPSPA